MSALTVGAAAGVATGESECDDAADDPTTHVGFSPKGVVQMRVLHR